MSQHAAIIIFVRNPVLGKVKTRIAQTLGAEKALLIYKKLLQHTHDIVMELNVDKYVFYSDYINHDDLWEDDIFKKELQACLDLGERMKNAFGYLFEQGYDHVGIIGSDCYELTTEILTKAFVKLEETEVVIGPGKDGGYYFIGTNNLLPSIFEGKSWSSETVFNDTIQQLKKLDIPYFKLPTLSDVDEEKDVTFNY